MDWQTYVNNLFNGQYGNCILQSSDGNYVFTGAIAQQDSPTYFANVYVVKLGQNVGVPNISPAPAVSVFPNPTTGMVNVTGINTATIKLYDLPGREVKEEKIKDNFSISDMPDGIYILRIFDEQQQLLYQDKLVKISK